MFSLLKKEIQEALDQIGFEKPTPIQEKVIPVALEGKDCLIQAKTGTGKTGAFGLPILNNIKRGEMALILAPTRELALQIRDNLRDFAKNLNLSVYAFYGGRKVASDLSLLSERQPDIVVGTPGRIRDLIERGALKTDSVRYFVLDEVDVMLDMNFKEDIDAIFSRLPEEKQVFFVSATFPKEVRNLAKQYTKNPVFISVETKELEPKIEERVLRTRSFGEKLRTLERVVGDFGKVIVFVNRKKDARFVRNFLSDKNIRAEALHGDLPQRKREEILKNFRKGKLKILVATDVASRGLDIEQVEAVINFQLPEDPKVYLHRIGRTGRMGKKGIALNLVLPAEDKNLERIEKVKRKKKE